jgi:prepilin-type N-terminal cleavage/methylation domain-containing protein
MFETRPYYSFRRAFFAHAISHRRCSASGIGYDSRPTTKHQTSNIKLCQGGFTLVELLVVIAIIGILLLLVAPAFTKIKSAGDVTSAAYTINITSANPMIRKTDLLAQLANDPSVTSLGNKEARELVMRAFPLNRM